MNYLLVEYVMTPNDIMKLILGVLGAIVIIVLGILLVYLIGVIKRVKGLVDDVSEPITEVVEALPDMIEPVQTLVDGASESVPDILDDLSSISFNLASAVELISDIFKKRGERQRISQQADSAGLQLARLVGFISGLMAVLKQRGSKKKKKK